MCIICIANSKSTISCGSVDFFILVLVPAWLGTVSMGPVQSCGLTCLYILYSLYILCMLAIAVPQKTESLAASDCPW